MHDERSVGLLCLHLQDPGRVVVSSELNPRSAISAGGRSFRASYSGPASDAFGMCARWHAYLQKCPRRVITSVFKLQPFAAESLRQIALSRGLLCQRRQIQSRLGSARQETRPSHRQWGVSCPAGSEIELIQPFHHYRRHTSGIIQAIWLQTCREVRKPWQNGVKRRSAHAAFLH